MDDLSLGIGLLGIALAWFVCFRLNSLLRFHSDNMVKAEEERTKQLTIKAETAKSERITAELNAKSGTNSTRVVDI